MKNSYKEVLSCGKIPIDLLKSKEGLNTAGRVSCCSELLMLWSPVARGSHQASGSDQAIGSQYIQLKIY